MARQRVPLEPLRYWPAPQPSLSVWSVARVKRALEDHERGRFRESAQLAAAMDRNPRIQSALNTRILAVLGLPFAVHPADEADKRRSASVAKRFEPVWRQALPESTLGTLLRWKLMLGLAVAEQVYATRGPDGWRPKRLKVVHPYHLEFDPVAERLFVYTADGRVPIEPGDPRWVVFSARDDDPWMAGIVRCLGMEDTARAYAIRDWVRRCEKHGLPIALAKVPERASAEDKDRFFDDVSHLGAESTVMAAQGATAQDSFDLELAEIADSKGELFSTLIDKMDTDVAIAILGQNLSSEVKGGSFAAAKSQERVRADLTEADAEFIATTAHDQIAAPWAQFNFGDPELAPWATYDATPPEDAAQVATTLKAAGEALAAWRSELAPQGLAPDAKAAAERFGLAVVPLAETTPPEPSPAPPGVPSDAADPQTEDA